MSIHLESTCPFPLQMTAGNKIGHLRADHDGYRWHSTSWPNGDRIREPTKALIKEFNKVYASLKDLFPNLQVMRNYCYNHAEFTGDLSDYSFYHTGKHGLYWIRCITRMGDYNLYIHCYAR